MSEATTTPTTNGEAPTPAPPLRKVTLYVVRHGQTHWNVEHRLPGQLPDVRLTEEGQRQADRLGEAVREMPLTAVVSSPLERARETAERVIAGRAIPLHFEPRLMDTNVGPWAGKLIADLNKDDPTWRAFVQRPTQPPAGVEGFYDVLQRVVAAAEAARHDESLGDYVMLVAHADVVKLLLSHYLRLPIEGAGWLQVPNASITALAFEGDRGPSVLALNWLPAPAWLKPMAEPKNESLTSAAPEHPNDPAAFLSVPDQPTPA
ncbi:MAG: histidine phosphatase family protein [Ktedonobacterales bacterium]|nr:histidine phosphatase family protein [Ktedonobacterales bacterium]